MSAGQQTAPTPVHWTEQRCFWCGEEATERDHVIPKSWFPRPRPDNLPTVPSCGPCNRGFQKDEDLTRIYLTSTANSNAAAEALYRGPVLRGIRRRDPLRRRVLHSIQRLPTRTPGGLYVEADFLIPEGDRAVRVLGKIVRGLYYREFGERLPADVPMRIRDGIDMQQARARWRALPGRRLGDVVVYRFHRMPNHPTRSLWYLMFYARSSFVAFTDADELLAFVNRIKP